MPIRPNASIATVLVVSAALLVSLPAGAEEHAAPAAPPASDASAGARADELVGRANKLAKQDRWAEAEPLFREAWTLKRSYDIAGNLGLAESALGKPRLAAAHLSFAASTFPVNGKPEHRALIEQALAKVRAQVGAVVIEISEPGAQVLVDGEAVGTSPLAGEVFLDPGAHTIEARLAGFAGVSQQVEAAPGSSRRVALVLERSAAPPSAAPARPPEPEGRARPGVGWIVAGGVLAAGALGAGLGLTVAANGKGAEARRIGEGIFSPSACHPSAAQVDTRCDDLQDALSARNTLSDAAVVGFVAGGALALGTLGLGAWVLSAPEERFALRALPAVGSGEGGVVMVGRW
ncbi:MAG: PEGA domain-containing protein [Polyangiaceae bacterium]|nr:PEGA domain-containing protein [Polyangiaceae bacterium]